MLQDKLIVYVTLLKEFPRYYETKVLVLYVTDQTSDLLCGALMVVWRIPGADQSVCTCI